MRGFWPSRLSMGARTPSFELSSHEVLTPRYNAFQHALDHSVTTSNGCGITYPSQEIVTSFFFNSPMRPRTQLEGRIILCDTPFGCFDSKRVSSDDLVFNKHTVP